MASRPSIYNHAGAWNSPAMTRRFITLPVAFVLCALFFGAYDSAKTAELAVETIVVETAGGAVELSVEIADTVESRRRGLMFRDALAWDHGMLFDFHEERPVAFWMKNTPLALDMLFIGSDGVIDAISADVPAFDETMRPSPGPVRAVLELRAGAAVRFGIAAGDRVRHRIFAH